jgi:hypothetical protein
MKLISWPQAGVLLLGFVFVMLFLFLPFSQFNIFYVQDEVIGSGVNVYEVTCPAPIDQPSCDDYVSPIRRAVCDDCNDRAGTRMTGFWVLESLTVLGTAAGYVIAGRLQKQKSTT